MSNLPAFLRQGMRLPPSGWALAGMLAFYVLAGLLGRDPWKGEDAIHIGAAWHMLQSGDWLIPSLAGRPFDEPPLYYWSAALTGKLFGAWLPLHDALRLASGFWVTLALGGMYYAGRELYGQASAAASALLLAGCMGLILHAHDAQPMLVALAAYAGGMGSLAAIARRPRLTETLYGLALAVCLLGTGILPTLPLLALAPLALWRSPDRRKATQAIIAALLLATALSALWLTLLARLEPVRFEQWLAAELAPFSQPTPAGTPKFLAILPWFAFPAVPLALWSLWLRRRALTDTPQLLPLALLGLTLLMLGLTNRPGEIPALLLLPSLAMLATPGALGLRRGAANAFDWFAMMTFTLFGLLVWVAWSALTFGWPAKLARRASILQPGFVPGFDLLLFLAAVAVSLWWLWLIVTAPRSPYRSLTHWSLGFTAFWMLATALLLPWFAHGKSYRPVAEAVARALPDNSRCLAERGLGDTQLASIAYFTGLEPLAQDTPAGRKCPWLLVAGDTRAELAAPDGGWTRVWEGSRHGDRKEKFRLYRR